jgi:hypothetical protein
MKKEHNKSLQRTGKKLRFLPPAELQRWAYYKESIMKIATKAIIATVLVVGIANIADASCRKSQVCDDYGNNCRVQDICDSTLDLPSVELAPLRPLPSTELKPLPSMNLPPLGTSNCQYMQVNGHWQNVCR